MADPTNTSLVTGATETHTRKRLDNLEDRVQQHIDAGFEAHAHVVKVNSVWTCTNGDTISSSKKLQLTALLNGGNVYVVAPVVT